MVIRLGFNSSWVKPTRGRGSHWVNVTHQQLKVSGNKNLHPTCLFRCPKTSLVRVGQSHLSTQLWSFKKISWFLIAQFIPRFILLLTILMRLTRLNDVSLNFLGVFEKKNGFWICERFSFSTILILWFLSFDLITTPLILSLVCVIQDLFLWAYACVCVCVYWYLCAYI